MTKNVNRLECFGWTVVSEKKEKPDIRKINE